MSRFDYVKYDETAQKKQELFKEIVSSIEWNILQLGAQSAIAGRAKALALTSLEECYMWIGKAIRDEQIQRNAQTELQEERKNG